MRLSPAYYDAEDLLDANWSGTYGSLGALIGVPFGRAVGRIVKAYAARHPHWPHERVFKASTRRPGASDDHHS